MKYIKLVFILLVLLLPGIVPAQPIEKTGYVTDTLFLTLREGPDKKYPVQKIIKSDDKVNIFEEENDYFKVQTLDGESGWVEKQYIIYSTPKTIIIEELNQTISDLESRIETLIASQDPIQKKLTAQQDTFKQTISSLETELEKTRGENETRAQELANLQEKYNTLAEKSAHVLEIQAENETLKKQNQSLSTQLNEIKSRGNDQLKTGMIKWFLAGVGVLMLGWFIGRNISSKKRRSGSLLD